MEQKINEIQQTLHEVLDAVNDLATNNENSFQKLETDMTTIKATMVTKDYMDVKLADLKGDLVLLMRKEDTKLKALVDILHQKKVISQTDAQHIFGMDPFPQAAL